MMIHVLSDYQITELRNYFQEETEVTKIGIACETGALFIEYETVGPYPALNKGLQTISIPRIKQ